MGITLPIPEVSPSGSQLYYRARYYDQSIGRFISEDPIGFRAGDNFYAYVGNGPTGKMDSFGLDPNWGPIVTFFRLFGPSQACPESKCSVSVSCLPTHGLQFTHCTVKTWDGSGYTDYDGMPEGENVLWTKLKVIQGTPHTALPPGPNSFFSANVPCDCAQNAANDINKGAYRYIAPVQNSNTAAQKMLNNCGAHPAFPFWAWGAKPWPWR